MAILTILLGDTTSNVINTADFNITGDVLDNVSYTPKCLLFPETTGSNFTFEVSDDGVTFYTLTDKLGEQIAVYKQSNSGGAIPLSAQDFAGWPMLRILSDETELGERKIKVMGYKI